MGYGKMPAVVGYGRELLGVKDMGCGAWLAKTGGGGGAGRIRLLLDVVFCLATSSFILSVLTLRR